MNINELKKGQKLKYEHWARKAVIGFGERNDNPSAYLSIGDEVTLKNFIVDNWHTELEFEELPGKYFNSVSFELAE